MPLSDEPRRRRRIRLLPYVEFLFGLYMLFCAGCSVIDLKSAMSAPFLAIFAFGFFYVSVMSFQAHHRAATTEGASPVTARVKV